MKESWMRKALWKTLLMLWVIGFGTLVSGTFGRAVAQQDARGRAGVLPPVPSPGEMIHDYEKLLTAEDRARIEPVLRQARLDHGSPIFVVTIKSMSDYGSISTIMEFSHLWFNHWRIGWDVSGGGASRGMMLLVSTGDRQAQIELGRAWGPHYREVCEKIMSDVVVERFKAGDASGGIRDGVLALGKLAAEGPKTPAQGLQPGARPTGPMYTGNISLRDQRRLTPYASISWMSSVVLLSVGLLALVGGLASLRKGGAPAAALGATLVGVATIPMSYALGGGAILGLVAFVLSRERASAPPSAPPAGPDAAPGAADSSKVPGDGSGTDRGGGSTP